MFGIDESGHVVGALLHGLCAFYYEISKLW